MHRIASVSLVSAKTSYALPWHATQGFTERNQHLTDSHVTQGYLKYNINIINFIAKATATARLVF